jgi:hypothetical protein
MTVSTRWSLLDAAPKIVHQLNCESVQTGADEPPLDLDASRIDDAVMQYGLKARSIYSDLKRLIGQLGGLLVLAQASRRRDALEIVSLEEAEATCREASSRCAALVAPGKLARHRARLAEAGRLVGEALAALRATRNAAGETVDLGPASEQAKRAYALLQAASESRFGMTMVDFRHACCNCGAINQQA